MRNHDLLETPLQRLVSLFVRLLPQEVFDLLLYLGIR